MRFAGMQEGDRRKDAVTAGLFVIGVWLLLSVFFDFYYDLNDDTAMKDILSGTYTGRPDGHNIQMLYPLGWCIALCYRLLLAVPWYGIFLCICQFGAVWTAVSRILCHVKKQEKKTAAALLLTAGIVGAFLYEFVFVQYTVTAGLLVCGALVRLLAGPGAEEAGFFRFQAGTAALVCLAFFLRTEMTLLLCPFLGLAVLFRLGLTETGSGNENINNKPGNGSVTIEGTVCRRRRFTGYAGLFLGTALLMGLGLGADHLAFGREAWKSFRQFFEDRTQVYDFYGLPDYETHREFYEAAGISEARYTLLDNYNFDLDEGIDTEMMSRIASYAAAHQETGAARRLYLSVYTYLYRFAHGQELAFDLLVVVSYFLLFRLAAAEKNRQLLGRLAMIGGVRTGLWLFLLYRGRVPERITHPLYLAELTMLGLLFLLHKEAFRWKKFERSAILSLYVLLLVCTTVEKSGMTRREYRDREQRNEQWQTWKAYCRERPDRFYYLDVYSTVAYSEKLFSDTSPSYRNFDLPGGWCVKSPVAARKREAAGIDSAQAALLEGSAFFVTDHTREERKPDFLIGYYKEKGVDVTLQQEDICGSFSIYRILATD